MTIYSISENIASNIITNRSFLLILGILFVLINGIIFSQLGVKIVADSSSIINYASQLNDRGLYIEPHYFWYIQYPLFILFSQSIHPDSETLVLLQYFLSFAALISLYFTSLRLFESRLTAFITGLLYISLFEISIYNTYILAVSYFISMISISLYFLIKWHKDGFTVANFLIGVPVTGVDFKIRLHDSVYFY